MKCFSLEVRVAHCWRFCDSLTSLTVQNEDSCTFPIFEDRTLGTGKICQGLRHGGLFHGLKALRQCSQRNWINESFDFWGVGVEFCVGDQRECGLREIG